MKRSVIAAPHPSAAARRPPPVAPGPQAGGRPSPPALLALIPAFLAGPRATGAPEAGAGAGRFYPPERSLERDPATGRHVVRLTASPAEDVKIYQTHPSWTADGEWIVFHSNRPGTPQLFAVGERNGVVVQLTDEPHLNTGQVCLSRKRLELLAVRDRAVVRLDLEPLLDPERPRPPAPSPAPGEGQNARAARPEVVGHLPAGSELSGTMSWDAAEKELYLGLSHPGRPSARWSIARLDLATGEVRTIVDLPFQVGHVQASPFHSGLLMYCHETGGDAPQRMWIVQADGTGNRPFYEETFGEWVTHEVWWDADRALFTVWPRDEAMRRKPHGIASVSLDGEVTFHSRLPYWHVTGAAGSLRAAADTFDGEIFRVDLESGERALLTAGHRPGRHGVHPHPTLRPDRKRVLFNSNAGGNADLYLVDLEGGSGGPLPARSMRYRRGTPEDARRWQEALRARLLSLLELGDLAAAKPPLEPRLLAATAERDYDLREVEILSTPARRIPLLLGVPRQGSGRRPAVVCIHGHGGDRRSVFDPAGIYKGFAARLAALGFVTVAVNVGQHHVYEKGRTLMGERLWDLMRCVDTLETLPEVDPRRIGCAGLSLGGEMAMWLGALDERIRATVSSGFLTSMDQMEENHCMCWKVEGLRELADYADIYSLVAPRALQCQNGLREDVRSFWVPLARLVMEEVEAIYEDLGATGKACLAVHPGGHEIDLESLVTFLEGELRQGAGTPASD